MNKKEIAEIKKRFTKTKCSFTRLCGCYVDADKQKRMTLKEAFFRTSGRRNVQIH